MDAGGVVSLVASGVSAVAVVGGVAYALRQLAGLVKRVEDLTARCQRHEVQIAVLFERLKRSDGGNGAMTGED